MPLSLSPARLASRHAALALLLVLGQARAEITVEERSLSTPAAKTATAPASTATEKVTISPGIATVSQDNNSWDSYNQLQQLQQQIEQMQGQLEQQGHLIDKLQADLRARYTDLDQRLNAQQEQLKSAPPAAPATAATMDAAPTSGTIEEEKKAYLAAYETFRAGGPDKAIP
ncbi:MAG TPA: YbgF trimerization domain-containing protein, partial [Moraxellaceae bacterium]